MKKEKLSIVILAAVGIVASMALPWFKAGSMSKSGAEGDGPLLAVLYAVPLILALISSKTASFSKGAMLGVVIPSLLASIGGIYEIYHAKDIFSSLGLNPFGSDFVHVSHGMYLVILAGLVISFRAFKSKEAA